MTFLASDVFDGARSPFLNDVGANLYTNTVLLPHLKAANEELEQLLIIYGSPVQRVVSTVIPVVAGAISLTIGGSPALPTDFLIPISLHERDSGASNQSWIEMHPRDFEPENQIPVNTFQYYAFRNNGISFPAALVNRDIMLKYDRQLAVISGASSPVDFYLSKRFLCARVAELAARYTGQNQTMANDLAIREVEPRKDDIERIFVLQGQNIRARRPPFSVSRNIVTR